MFKTPLLSTRLARPDDSNDCADIDAKAFEIAWGSEEWYDLVRNSYKEGTDEKRTVIVCCYYGTPVGFAVMQANGNECLIQKLAVKEQWRRQRAASVLLHDVVMRAQDKRLTSVALIMPESYIYPDGEGQPTLAIKWATKVGLKAVTPIIKDHFTGYGTTEDGVKFIAPMDNAPPKN